MTSHETLSPPTPDELLDAGQTACGELIMLVFARMKALPAGKVLEVVAYDAGAREDIAAWCRMTHNELVHWVEGGPLTEPKRPPDRYFIRKSASS